MQHTGNTTNSLWESGIYRQQVWGMTCGSMLVTEEQWRRLPFEMGYKIGCLYGGVFLMWGPGGQCPDSSEKIRPTRDDFTSPGPDTLQKQLWIRMTRVSSSQEYGAPHSHLTLSLFNYTISQFHTFSLSPLEFLPYFSLFYNSSLLQHIFPLFSPPHFPSKATSVYLSI